MIQTTINKNSRTAQLKKLLQIMKEEGPPKKSPFYTLKASQKRAQLITYLFLKAYEENSKVVFRNVIMPTEIFYAMGIVPICVETVCSLFASFNLSRRYLNVAEQNNYSRDICSFTRCTLGAAIENYLPTPDFLACTSYYCDDSAKLFYTLSKKYEKDFFLLDIPYDYKDENAVSYLEIQLKEMTRRIEKQLNKKIDPDKLSEAIRLSNEARYYYVKLNDLRANIPAPISGGEAIDYAAMLASTWGSKEIVEVYKTLYKEVKKKVENSVNPGQKTKTRILWRHLRPYHNNSLFDFIENKCQAEIAFEEVNYIHWEEMDPKEPYRSLARKLLANPPVGNFQHWTDATLSSIDKYSIDGVISFNHWGCRQLCSGEGILRDILNKKSIPIVDLGGDCIDKRDYSFAQLKTRIQAFLEMIKEKKG